MMLDPQLVAFAHDLADAARGETLSRWRAAGAARNKAAAGAPHDPVTEADMAAETAMRALIEARFPGHGISGEELDERPAAGRFAWSLDPIDGTRSFVCGLPTWTTLIALLADGAPALGIIDAPRLGERYLGHGGEAILHDASGEHMLRVSGCARLGEARFSTTDPALFTGGAAEAVARLSKAVRTIRYGHDAYAYARLAAGSIDLVVESGLKPHDYNALIPVIRGAGGIVGNWRGEADVSNGEIVAAATQALFEEAVGMLRVAEHGI
ncbi:MAG TPA: inositol monophosphatase family protein [Allosphingosinicella sp.]|nr:inositol monophosphatase family protein [Allosphingosinicella sp.]